MTDYNEEVDEFAPAKPDLTAPATVEPEQVQQADTEPVQQVSEPGKANNAYDSIIANQNDQIAALIAQNKSLTDQITALVNSGAQIGQGAGTRQVTPMQQFNTPSLQSNDDWSLEALAKDIGKRERR